MKFPLVPRILICSLVLLLAACDFSEATGSATTDPPPPTDTPTAQPAPAPTGVASTGENYEITIVNDSIKSPRKELAGTIDGVDITINYGSPAVNGRTIYGDLVPYGKVWRTGANEATQINFSAPVAIGTEGSLVPAGTYSFFTEPASKESWAFIVNKDDDQWGAYDYTADLDVARAAGTATPTENFSERMDFSLDAEHIRLHWADLVIALPIKKAE